MPRLALSLLGSFQVTLDDQLITHFKSNRVRALLAFLAVESDRAHRRKALAALLWPEYPDRAALDNLRDCLCRLRSALHECETIRPHLLVTRDTVQFDRASDAWVDVLVLRESLAATRGAAADHDRLAAGMALYRGPFLEAFALDGSAAFEEWLLATREGCERTALAALATLAARDEARGDYGQAEAWVRRQLELAPWLEEAHRTLMRLLALSGQRSAALAQYQVCRRLLAKELAVGPAAETVALYRRIREGEVAPGTIRPPVARPVSRTLGSGIFVAREAELARLRRHLDAALSGEGRTVFICGDAGSGKSALMAEFARQAMRRHGQLLVAGGRCDALTGAGDPYLPFREIAQMLTEDIEDCRAAGYIIDEQAVRLWSALPATAAALLNVAPDLLERFVRAEALALRLGTMPPAGARLLPPDWRNRLQERTRYGAGAPVGAAGLEPTAVFGQFTAFLLSLARSQPLVLLLDDLHWADGGSLNLLFHVGRRLAGARILLVGAYRPEAVATGRDGGRHPLQAVANELSRVCDDAEIDLDQADGRQFLAAMLDSEANHLGPAFRETLYRHTNGNPLFTVEVLRSLRERGDLTQDKTGAWVEGLALHWDRLPRRIEAVIAERIGRLSPDAQALLSAASVEGEEFVAEVAAAAVGIGRAEALDLLSDVLDRQHKLVRGCSVSWLEPGQQPLSRYRFLHFLFCQYLYGQLDPVRKAQLHQLAGETLEQFYGPRVAEIAVQLARHFEQAGMLHKSVDCLLQAGYQALELSAYEEAAADLQRGLTLLATLPESPERAQSEARLQLALSGLLMAVHGPGDASRVDAAARALALSRRAGGGRQTLYALWSQADACRYQGQFEAAAEMGRKLQVLAAGSQDRQAAMLAHSTLGITSYCQGAVLQARNDLEKALSLYSDAEDRQLIGLTGVDIKAWMLVSLAHVLSVLGYAELAARRAQEAIDLAQELAHPWTFGRVVAARIWLEIHQRRNIEDLQQPIETLQRLVDEKGLVTLRPWAGVHSGWLLGQSGRTTEGIEQMRSSIKAWQSAGTVTGVPGMLVMVARVCLDAGLYEEGLAAVSEAMKLLERGIGHMFEAELYRLRGALTLVAAAEGSLEAAEADFLKAIEVAREQQARVWELRAAVSLAQLRQQQGRAQDAAECLAAIYGQFSEGFDTADLREASALLDALSGHAGVSAPAPAS